MKPYYYILILFSISLTAFGQEFGSNIKEPGNTEPTKLQNGFNPDVSVSLGTSFTSYGPGLNSFGTFVMPEFLFPVSEKFAVKAGIGYSSLFYSTPMNEGSVFSGSNTQFGTVFISGIYRVNPRLTIEGTAFKTFQLNPNNGESIHPAMDFSNEGIIMNADYKVTEKFRINVGISYQKRNPYNYYNPYFNGGLSPFNSGNFNTGFGPGF